MEGWRGINQLGLLGLKQGNIPHFSIKNCNRKMSKPFMRSQIVSKIDKFCWLVGKVQLFPGEKGTRRQKSLWDWSTGMGLDPPHP